MWIAGVGECRLSIACPEERDTLIMMMKRLIFLMALPVVAGCGSSSPPAPTVSGAPYSQQDLVVGTGVTANIGNTITVGYSVWLYDSTKAEGKGQLLQSNPSTQFVLSSGLIGGWVRGVPGMRVGGQRRLVVPPDLGYGAAGSPPTIPPNATLVFDITMLGVT
jgi:FKBP-type peptidyl-prolyl cis-trans isomerase